MKAASMKPEVALLNNEDMKGIEEDVDWQFVSLGEQQNFGIRTSGNFCSLQKQVMDTGKSDFISGVHH